MKLAEQYLQMVNYGYLINEAITNNEEMASEIEKVIKKHFPNSFISVNTQGPLGSKNPTLRFAFEKKDFPNNIKLNDPLWTMIFFTGFSNKDGALGGTKVKADLSQGDSFRINGQPLMKFKWRNQTATPENIIKKLDKYFGSIQKWLGTPEGKDALKKHEEDLKRS